jgi:hypothetical protein
MRTPDTAAVIDLAFYVSVALGLLAAALVLAVGALLWSFAAYMRSLGSDDWSNRRATPGSAGEGSS